MPCLFSEAVLGSTSMFSPDSKYVAIASGSRLTVRLADTMETLHVFSCVDKVEKMAFSPDSQYIMCGMYSRDAVQIFSIADGEWRCRVNEGVAGIVDSSWTPDSRSVMTESDYGLQLAVWNLVDSTSQTISKPKSLNNSAVPVQLLSSPCNSNKQAQLGAFSDCGSFYAVVLRTNAQDEIGIYTCEPWGIANRFKCKSSDVSAVTWTPCSHYLVTVDSALCYAAHVYDLHGQHVSKFEAYKHALGIRSCVFHRVPEALPQPPSVQFFPLEQRRGPSVYPTLATSQVQLAAETKHNAAALPLAQFTRTLSTETVRAGPLLAVGSFDGRVRLLSRASWKCAYVLPLVHPGLMEPGLAVGTVCTVELTAAQAKSANHYHASGESLEAEDPAAEEQAALRERQLIFSMTASKGNKAATAALKSRGACYVKSEAKVLPQRAVNKYKTQTGSSSVPSRGVVWTGWSADGSLLAARDATQPQCLWIWDGLQAQLASLLVQLDSITCARWRPLVTYDSKAGDSSRAVDAISVLAFCCGAPRIYFWSPEAGPTWADLPIDPDTGSSIVANSVQWSADGMRLLVQGSEGLCTAAVFLDKQGGAQGVLSPPRTGAGRSLMEEELGVEAGSD